MFVNVHTICARTLMLVAGMVNTCPASVPNVPAGLPDAPALLSTQDALEIVKLVVAPSVIVTAVPVLVARIGGGVVGVGEFAANVVIDAGVDRRLVEVNVNAPPAEPNVVLRTATVAVLAVVTAFVSTQVMFAPARILAAGIVIVLVASVPKLAGFPVMAELASVQLTDDAVKPAAGVSVIVTAVLKAVTAMGVGTAGVAVFVAVVVISGGAEAKFVDVNVNAPPMAPEVIF